MMNVLTCQTCLIYPCTMNLKEYKPQFDSYLHQRLNAKLSEVQPLFPDEETFSLVEYLKPYVDHGKRFRPYMVSLWYSIY